MGRRFDSCRGRQPYNVAESSRSLRPLLRAAFLLYIVLTVIVTLHHEAWGDEADPWLLMRDGGMSVMLSRGGYRGTPALWYIVIAPFASAGLPYLSQQLLNLAFIWFAVFLFLKHSPFTPAVKVLFLFGYYAFSEYAVKARQYALLIALLFAIVALWTRRRERPLLIAVLVALLANTAVHGLIFAAVIGLVFAIDAIGRRDVTRRANIAAMVIMIVGGLACVAQLLPAPDGQKLPRFLDPQTIPWSIGTAFLPFVDMRYSFVAGLLIFLAAVIAIGDRTLPLVFTTVSIAALLVLYQFVLVGGYRHTGLILIVLLAGVWMALGEVRPQQPSRLKAFRTLEVALALCFAWSVYANVRDAVDEIRFAHSGSREMAAYIAGNVHPSTIIAAHRPYHCAPTLVYLPGRLFWFPAYGRFGSYTLWDRAFQDGQSLAYEPAIDAARRQLAGRNWLLLINHEMPENERGFRLLYTNRIPVYSTHRDERYWLYKPVG